MDAQAVAALAATLTSLAALLSVAMAARAIQQTAKLSDAQTRRWKQERLSVYFAKIVSDPILADVGHFLSSVRRTLESDLQAIMDAIAENRGARDIELMRKRAMEQYLQFYRPLRSTCLRASSQWGRVLHELGERSSLEENMIATLDALEDDICSEIMHFLEPKQLLGLHAVVEARASGVTVSAALADPCSLHARSHG